MVFRNAKKFARLRPSTWSLPTFALAALGVAGTVAAAPTDICDAGDQVVLEQITLTTSCTVTGDLSIGPGGGITADFTANPDEVFSVAGNVTLTADARLQVEGGTLEIQQDHNRHREIQSFDYAAIIMRDAELVLNQGSDLKYMVYNAHGNSMMIIVNSVVDISNSWLLANFFGYSKLIAIDSLKMPTEIYVKEGATIQVAGETTNVGIWLDLTNDMYGTIDLPEQVDANGNLQPFSWTLGRNSAALSNVAWQLEVAGASPGLGIESHEDSQITINGQGEPANGELRISYHVESGTKTLSNLAVGLQNKTLDDGRLVLNNVHLGLVSWQIYVLENEMLTITNSVLNEVGASANGHVEVYDSIFQFAGATAMGWQSTLDIYNSQIHSQTMEALRDGIVNVYDSAIYGAAMVAHLTTGEIHVHRGALLQNATGECPFSAEIMNEWGVPSCNPFLEPGAEVSTAGEGVFTCTDTVNCTW